MRDRFASGFARLGVITCVLLILGSSAVPARSADDPLPSWNDTATKRTILAFVAAVTDPESGQYVSPEDRIATFDNDGTLWCEKPIYVHFQAIFARMREQIAADASLAKREPYRSVAAKGPRLLHGPLRDRGVRHDPGRAGGRAVRRIDRRGIRVADARVARGVEAPSFRDRLPATRLSADGRARAVPSRQRLQGLHLHRRRGRLRQARRARALRDPPGTRLRIGGPSRVRRARRGRDPRAHVPRLVPQQLGGGKPRLIHQAVGRRPLLAGGNSNGDFHMLQWTNDQSGPHLSILLHHTDAAREYAYDAHTDEVMPEAKKRGWTVIDMQRDWKVVFPEPS